MRKNIVAGNWKMNKTLKESQESNTVSVELIHN